MAFARNWGGAQEMKTLLCKSSVLNLTLNWKAFAGLGPLTSVEHLTLSGLQLNSFFEK